MVHGMKDVWPSKMQRTRHCRERAILPEIGRNNPPKSCLRRCLHTLRIRTETSLLSEFQEMIRIWNIRYEAGDIVLGNLMGYSRGIPADSASSRIQTVDRFKSCNCAWMLFPVESDEWLVADDVKVAARFSVTGESAVVIG